MIANILKIPKKKENNRKVQKIMNRRFTWTVNIPDLNSNQKLQIRTDTVCTHSIGKNFKF